jgi:hypothetical protein
MDVFQPPYFPDLLLKPPGFKCQYKLRPKMHTKTNRCGGCPAIGFNVELCIEVDLRSAIGRSTIIAPQDPSSALVRGTRGTRVCVERTLPPFKYMYRYISIPFHPFYFPNFDPSGFRPVG